MKVPLPSGRRIAPLALPVLAAVAVLALLGGAFAARASLPWRPGAPAAATASPSPDASVAPSSSAGNGGDNSAVAVNTKDGKTVWAIRLKIVHNGKDISDETNAAVAVASCSDCTTVAIALEGVLVWGDPEVVAPTNVALAYNVDCTSCRTLAAAYQDVIGTGGKVRITGQGRKRIAAIRQDLHQLRQENLTLAEVAQRVDADAAAFLDVLRTEVVPIGATSASPEPTAAAGPVTASPTASGSAASPSPSASVSASPSASASPTAQTSPQSATTPTPTPTP